MIRRSRAAFERRCGRRGLPEPCQSFQVCRQHLRHPPGNVELVPFHVNPLAFCPPPSILHSSRKTKPMRWFITFRYLLSHKRQSLVCIAGVTISVTMFIAMSALMDGFSDKFIIETVESSGHITIKDEPRETRTPILENAYPNPNALLALSNVKPRDTIRKIDNPTGLLRSLEAMPGIIAAAPDVF